MREPIHRRVATLADAHAFIREAIDAGYLTVYFTPRMFAEIKAAAATREPSERSALVPGSVSVYPEPALVDGSALAVPEMPVHLRF